ncbi:alpha-amylase family glycosyl hydrolase [Fervidobacterium thailandense]|uniref:Alpha-amylase n=1 Tax=Fervidobacterium thailandense TaxID=1008305 RepID=A0A1E3G181_9BACT|nr:alpha-amylase family glycosyl hydrolase [Fervidobacterium thailandense]ODN29985.1 hypothetical protein A4H02_07870 [Fervidobacterium thailandense]
MYKLFIRSFYDSNGDGIGDFKGVMEKVDYLKSLADVIWFLPFGKCTTYHGYDPVDFYDVNPEYGTLDDLEEMIKVLNENGIAVVMDLVINHTSWEHPWFKDAVERTTESPYWNYYIMSLERPENANNRWYSIKNSKGQEIWYFGLFDRTMPDLNFENPEVKKEVERIVDFWITVGVNGFRIDAVKNFFGWEWSDAIIPSAQYSGELYNYIQNKYPGTIVVGEAYDGNPYVLSKFAPLPVFNFKFMFEITNNYLGRDGMLTDSLSWLNSEAYVSPFYHFPFLDNHDRDRLISVLIGAFRGNELSATKHYLLLNALLLTMPGISAIYYGNEIGLRGLKFPEAPWDMGVREPMQWYADGEGPGQTSWTRQIYEKLGLGSVISAYDKRMDGISVEEQDKDPLSILNFFRSLVELRKSYEALRNGSVEIITDSRNLYAYKVYCKDETILVLLNINLRRNSTFTLDDDYEILWEARFDGENFAFGQKKGVLKLGQELVVPARSVVLLSKK